MPYFTNSQEWLQQSTLLLQARPSTAKITTKYTLPSLTSRGATKSSKRKNGSEPQPAESATDAASSTAAAAAPRAVLTLKTWDPVSGVCLKYRTDKAQEVGRLVAGIGRLGREMAALPPSEDTTMSEAPPASEGAAGASTTTTEGVGKDAKIQAADSKPGQQSGGGGGGGGKKKKKNKR